MIGFLAEPFGPGDTILLGPNLPHWWRPDPSGDRTQEEAIVLQFGPSLFLPQLLELPEFKSIEQLRTGCTRGISFDKVHERHKVQDLLLQLLEHTDSGLRWLGAMNLLKELSLCHPRKILPEGTRESLPKDVIEKAIQHMLANLTYPLKLEGVASIAGLHPVHFSRRFKESVGMSFPQFLRHHRIARVCQDLLKPHSLAHLAHDNGFQNLSTFNRSFRLEKGCSPKEYRERLRISKPN